jgi:ATP-dependent helicase/nuclease subunit A
MADQEGEAALQGETTGVQIMTIHDAKGEEFPVVVVPGMTRKFYDQGSVGDGTVEFETIDGTPWAGIKSPDPQNPFETANTLVRDRLRSRRRDEERAEEKRILYVAATRARDKLVFVGRHTGTVDNDGEPVFDRPDSDTDPQSWGDLISPILIPEGAADRLATAPTQRMVLTAPDDDVGEDEGDVVVTPAFAGDGTSRSDGPPIDSNRSEETGADNSGDVPGSDSGSVTAIGSEYLLRLPDASCPSYETSRTTTPEYDVSPTPSPTALEEYEYRITASSLPNLLDGTYETDTELNEAEGIVRVESGSEIRSLTTATDPDQIPRRILGDIVHAIAERRPPGEQWPTLARTVARRHELGYEPTPADIEAVVQQATAACEYVDSQTPADPVMTADELSVTVELSHGVIWGDIDHLIVTADECILIDYKTNAVGDDPTTVNELAQHYQPQLDAYAIGLAGGSECNRSIRTVLYFTDPQSSRERTYSDTELTTLRRNLDERIRTRLFEML